MKFQLVASVLSCALLSLAYAEVAVTEGIPPTLVEVSQNVDSPAAVVAEPAAVGSPEIPKVLALIPEPDVQPAAGEAITDQAVEEAFVVPQTETTVNNRETQQLIGFIPSYVLRHAIRMAHQQQYNDGRSFRSFRHNNEDDGSSDGVEEGRAIRRRKRYRTRGSNDHSKTTRQHKNTNRQSVNRRKNMRGIRRTHNSRGSTQNLTRQKKTKRQLRRVKSKRKKVSKGGY